jgi:putative SOS response-associated peptidase YedK
MCFSAMCKQAYQEYVRRFGAAVSLEEFARLYGFKQAGLHVQTARAMDLSFAEPASPEEAAIRDRIAQFKAQKRSALASELAKQRQRLAAAVQALQARTTKKAEDEQRIASRKIAQLEAKLADLDRTEIRASDERIFPGYYVPVMIWEDGRRVVKPMRYQCRPAGKPASYDTRYPGTYNARRDNLEGFWKEQFGRTHAVMLVSRFYENVLRHDFERRPLRPGETEQSMVVEFRPPGGRDLVIACLYSRWTQPGEPELWSFAAITDEPPPEVRMAGHDRCIVAIREENIDAWLQATDLAHSYALLDDRERLVYTGMEFA